MMDILRWEHILVLFCCIFWLVVYFLFLGPFLVWFTGESDLDANPTTTSKHTSGNSPPNRVQQCKRQRKQEDFY